MKVTIVSNDYPQSKRTVENLQARLKKTSVTIDDTCPDIVLTVGGDGTLLTAFHDWQCHLDEVRFVGVHTGHLGFYTDWRDYELDELVESLEHDNGESVSYPLLSAEALSSDGQTHRYLALNESTIRKVNQTMVSDILLDGQYFERFRGDGLSIATPTGSTGYNRSIGGAVINPNINALQLTEIASLNSRVYRTLNSPIIVSESETIQVELDPTQAHILTIDQLTYDTAMLCVCYQIAKERIHFAKYRHMPFWHRVQDAFVEGTEELCD